MRLATIIDKIQIRLLIILLVFLSQSVGQISKISQDIRKEYYKLKADRFKQMMLYEQ